MAESAREAYTAHAKAAPKIAAKISPAPDYVTKAKKTEDTVLQQIEDNQIYQIIIGSGEEIPKEQRIAKVYEYLTAGLEDGTAKVEELDRRRKTLTEFNAFIQVVRKQLGTEQAREITSKAYSDFQRIVTDTTTDVGRFQDELMPLGKLAELFSKYGADGNIIEKITLAKKQKQERDERLGKWNTEHKSNLRGLEVEVTNLRTEIEDKKDQLAENSKGALAIFYGRARAQLEADIANLQDDLKQREEQYATMQAVTPPEEIIKGGDDVEQVDEEILELQNIGGEAFKTKVTELREHTEEALAKIATNFDEAVVGLTNTRESFTNMDRNCGDADFALSVLEVGVQQAQAKSRALADNVLKAESKSEGALAELERMEKERRSEQILSYTGYLDTFIKDVSVAVASLRSGQAVIKNVLRMNRLALESANTHKMTGIANTADAVTITIGTIIEVCNRAASRALADGITMMRNIAKQGNERLASGAYETLVQQNEQLGDFVESVANLKAMTKEITVNTTGLLRDQFELVRKMREESGGLADAVTESERAAFAARAGIDEASASKKPEGDASKPRGFGLKMK